MDAADALASAAAAVRRVFVSRSGDGSCCAKGDSTESPPMSSASEDLSPKAVVSVSTLSETLQEAAVALRRVVPHANRCASKVSGAQPRSRHDGAASPVVSRSAGLQVSSDMIVLSSPESVCVGHFMGGMVPVQQLMLDNSKLRDAFHDAARRISALDEEKSTFFGDGVFDLANSVCDKADVQTSANAGDSSSLRGECCPLLPGLEMRTLQSLSLPTSVGAPSPGRACQRTELLSDENAALLRELMRANEVNDKLELQQRAAEGRTLQLEHERTWLSEQLAGEAVAETTDASELGANTASDTTVDVDAVSAELCAADAEAADAADARRFEELGQKLRQEFLEGRGETLKQRRSEARRDADAEARLAARSVTEQ